MQDIMYEDESLQRFWEDSSKWDVPLHWALTAVLVALTNAPFLLTLALSKKVRTPTLVNIAAADLLALLCLPFNYIHHFDSGWPLGSATCTAFLILRDISAAAQTFSCVTLSIANCRQANNPPSTSHTSSPHHQAVIVANRIPALFQFAMVWFPAILFSVCLAAMSGDICSVHLSHKLILEEISAKYYVRIRCLIFGIIPISITLMFLLLAAFRKSITPNSVSAKYHEKYLLMGFVVLLVINNFSGYMLCLSTLSLYPQVSRMYLDYSMFFPTYITACSMPLLVYCSVPRARRHFNRSVLFPCSRRK